MTKNNDIFNEDFNDGYYHIGKDVEDHPECTIFIVWSPRGPGKTYGGLRYPYVKGFPIIYMKRTVEDVNFICEYSGEDEFDPSPWKPLNRDFGTNVKPRLIKKGIGIFHDVDYEGNPIGKPKDFVLALNKIKSIKGIDLTEADWMEFDEFIPQTGEIVRRAEGEMLLDLYMTVNRDRQKRGRPPLKLILFANSEEISTPITNALEVVDIMAEMLAKKLSIHVDKERGIFLHHILPGEFKSTEIDKEGMYKAMQGTAWARKAYEGEFANNDFSNVCEMSLKHMRCLYHVHFRSTHDMYIYLNPNTGMYYATNSKGNFIQSFNLDKENDQKRFYLEHVIDLRNECIEDRFKFRKYSYYDLIMNYKKFYEV